LGEVGAINAAVEAFRNTLRDPSRTEVKRVARALDEKVMRPVRALLRQSTHLLISPDGQLNLIPIAALLDEHERYLIERYSITYLTSGRDLLRLQVPRESQQPPVIVADPAFGDPPTVVTASGKAKLDDEKIIFTPLRGAREEVRAIKEFFPTAIMLTKEQATETALKQITAPSFLHIATHGFFLEEQATPPSPTTRNVRRNPATRMGKWIVRVANPLLRSGLALAGANQGKNGEEDGILTALEAAGLNLWGTQLVVLSACDTGVGEVRNGDGVYGLRRALILAGVESQIMSLWPVADTSTRDLMTGYYNALQQGEGRNEALRRVQLQMLQNKDRQHPFYWASFIQSGKWTTLAEKR
jgi:CHAT domain-containing protein